MKAFGVILIVAGILMMIFREVGFTQEKKLVDVGPVHINSSEHKTVAWPTYVGAIAVVAGVAVLFISRKKY